MNKPIEKPIAFRDWTEGPLGIALAVATYPIFYLVGEWMHRHMIIAEDVLVTPEWTEYVSKRPMRTKRQCQEICLWVDECGSPDDRSLKRSGSLILADGTIVSPEVQIEDEFGELQALKGGHYCLGGDNLANGVRTINYAGYDGDLHNRKFASVLVRSDKPFRCSKITWHNYNLK